MIRVNFYEKADYRHFNKWNCLKYLIKVIDLIEYSKSKTKFDCLANSD